MLLACGATLHFGALALVMFLKGGVLFEVFSCILMISVGCISGTKGRASNTVWMHETYEHFGLQILI